MAKLTNDVKIFIVQELACFDTPSQVSESVKEVFGIVVDRAQIQTYDPYKALGKDLSQKLKEIFDATRKAFLENVSAIPIAQKSYRLRALQRAYDYFVSRKNYVAANQILEQAAKEEGGLFTNRIKLGGDGENPLLVFAQQITGGSLPVVEDVEGEFELIPETPKAIEKPPVKKPEWNTKTIQSKS